MGVNSLPKTVTRQRRDCDLNTGPSAPESSTLTTRLPSHRADYTAPLFCLVLQPSSIRGLATPRTYFLYLSLSSVILTDCSTKSPVHVLMLSIQAVRGLPRLQCAPGIISFSRQLPCFLMV